MDRGRAGLEKNRKSIAQKLWQLWSPGWFNAEQFEPSARSFDNPDFVSTAIHSYRHRYGNAAGDPALEALEKQLAEQPKIAATTIGFHGEDDRVNPRSTPEGKKECLQGTMSNVCSQELGIVRRKRHLKLWHR
jgi:hypothetical protein